MNGKTALLCVAALFATALSACSSSKPLTIAITTPPPSSIEIGNTSSINAMVANDPSSAGVDWSCTPAAACGTFTPAHTASGSATTYQAPNTTGSVIITAASTKNATVTATANVTVNPVGTTSGLTGTYVYYANGWDSNSNSYSLVGSITLDGSGNVTGGEQDYFDLTSGVPDTADAIAATGGTITLGSDGRGTLTFTVTNLNGGTTETFSVVLVNNDHLLITEFDSSATSSGSMDLQTAPASVPMGGNAFSLLDTSDALVFGGVLTSNGTSTTATELDVDYQGTTYLDLTLSGDTITPPDGAGRGTMTIDGFQFAYYVVGPEAFRFIEIDGNIGGFYLAGSMFGQGTAAGAYSPASLNGSYAFGQNGQDGAGGIFEYGLAGQFTTDASSAFTAGAADFNQGDGNPVLAATLTGSAYTVDLNGYGSITLASALDGTLQNFGVYLVDPALNIADPNNSSGGGCALMVDLDANSLGIGIIAPQTSGATFAGNYAFNQDGTYQSSAGSAFFDLIGQVLSDGSSKFAGNADFNDLGNTGQNASEKISGTFTPDPSNAGRSTATLTITGNGATTNDNITLYQASDDLIFHVDMDSAGLGTGNTAVGVFEKQQ